MKLVRLDFARIIEVIFQFLVIHDGITDKQDSLNENKKPFLLLRQYYFRFTEIGMPKKKKKCSFISFYFFYLKNIFFCV